MTSFNPEYIQSGDGNTSEPIHVGRPGQQVVFSNANPAESYAAKYPTIESVPANFNGTVDIVTPNYRATVKGDGITKITTGWSDDIAYRPSSDVFGKGSWQVGRDVTYSDGFAWKASSLTTASFARFDGVTGKATLPKTYILASDGDYIEFVAKLEEYQISATALAMLGEFGTNQNYLSPSFTAGNFTIRENTGAAKDIAYTQNPLEWQRYRLTQTSAILWTFAVNGVDVGTIVRADVIKVNCIGAGYSTNFCKHSMKELTISTATTGSLTIKDFANELLTKTADNSGVTTVEFNYSTDSLVAIANPVGIVALANQLPLINIYLPQTNSTKYLQFQYENTVDAAKNADVWRIKRLYTRVAIEFPFIWGAQRILTTDGGEWENAVRLKDDDDFFGGTSHGKDVRDSNTLSIDGVSSDINTFAMGAGNEIHFTQTSKCYKKVGADYAAVHVANSARDWKFNPTGLLFSNTLTWLTSETTTSAYLAMAPITRSDGSGAVTEWGLSGLTPVPVDISTAGFPITKSTADTIAIFSDASGVDVRLNILNGWTKTGRLTWIDNSAPYNKLYCNFYGESDYVTAIGERIIATTNYSIRLTK